MRRALVLGGLVAALVAPAAGSAAARAPVKLATFHPRTIHLVHVLHRRRSASCSAHTRTGAAVDRVARKVVPVACEQPPRSWLGLDLSKAAVAAVLGS